MDYGISKNLLNPFGYTDFTNFYSESVLNEYQNQIQVLDKLWQKERENNENLKKENKVLDRQNNEMITQFMDAQKLQYQHEAQKKQIIFEYDERLRNYEYNENQIKSEIENILKERNEVSQQQKLLNERQKDFQLNFDQFQRNDEYNRLKITQKDNFIHELQKEIEKLQKQHLTEKNSFSNLVFQPRLDSKGEEKLNEQLNILKNECSEQEVQLIQLKEQIQSLKEENHQQAASINNQLCEIDSLQTQIKELNFEFDIQIRQNEEKDLHMDKENQRFLQELAKMDRQLSEVQSQNLKLRESEQSIKEKLHSSHIPTQNGRLSELIIQNNQSQKQYTLLQEKYNTERIHHEYVIDQLKTKMPLLQFKKQEYQNLSSNFQVIKKKLDSSVQKTNILSHQLKSTEQTVENLDRKNEILLTQLGKVSGQLTEMSVINEKLKEQLIQLNPSIDLTPFQQEYIFAGNLLSQQEQGNIREIDLLKKQILQLEHIQSEKDYINQDVVSMNEHRELQQQLEKQVKEVKNLQDTIVMLERDLNRKSEEFQIRSKILDPKRRNEDQQNSLYLGDNDSLEIQEVKDENFEFLSKNQTEIMPRSTSNSSRIQYEQFNKLMKERDTIKKQRFQLQFQLRKLERDFECEKNARICLESALRNQEEIFKTHSKFSTDIQTKYLKEREENQENRKKNQKKNTDFYLLNLQCDALTSEKKLIETQLNDYMQRNNTLLKERQENSKYLVEYSEQINKLNQKLLNNEETSKREKEEAKVQINSLQTELELKEKQFQSQKSQFQISTSNRDEQIQSLTEEVKLLEKAKTEIESQCETYRTKLTEMKSEEEKHSKMSNLATSYYIHIEQESFTNVEQLRNDLNLQKKQYEGMIEEQTQTIRQIGEKYNEMENFYNEQIQEYKAALQSQQEERAMQINNLQLEIQKKNIQISKASSISDEEGQSMARQIKQLGDQNQNLTVKLYDVQKELELNKSKITNIDSIISANQAEIAKYQSENQSIKKEMDQYLTRLTIVQQTSNSIVEQVSRQNREKYEELDKHYKELLQKKSRQPENKFIEEEENQEDKSQQLYEIKLSFERQIKDKEELLQKQESIIRDLENELQNTLISHGASSIPSQHGLEDLLKGKELLQKEYDQKYESFTQEREIYEQTISQLQQFHDQISIEEATQIKELIEDGTLVEVLERAAELIGQK